MAQILDPYRTWEEPNTFSSDTAPTNRVHQATQSNSLSSRENVLDLESFLSCSHCQIAFSDVEEWYLHCRSVHPSPVQLVPPQRMGMSFSMSKQPQKISSDSESTESCSANDNVLEDENMIAQQELQVLDQGSKSFRRTQKHQKWDSIKTEVHRLYVSEGHTLQATIAEIEQKYSFKASLRKWKMQIKEWHFDKNLTKNDMAILVAKAQKRARDEGKETIFYHQDQEVSAERLSNFKKRKVDAASPSAATPMNITYATPKAQSELDPEQETEQATKQNDSHKSIISMLSISHALTTETACVKSLLTINDPWLTDKATHLSNLLTYHPSTRLSSQLELAQLYLSYGPSYLGGPKIILSTMLEHITSTNFSLSTSSPRRVDTLDSLAEQWKIIKPIEYLSTSAVLEPEVAFSLSLRLTGIVHEMRRLLFHDEKYGTGAADGELAGLFISAAMICSRFLPGDALVFFDEMIERAGACQGYVAQDVRFLALLCRGLVFKRKDEGRSEVDFRAAREVLKGVDQGDTDRL
ncbi:uncharacterized protein LY89DRAFT_789494 [Mollisia scopiformis]|uniref:C2H2-type domain-containing protein n=1 Tax=Mollisia scopiformis TaxID=149040 RepID=A0A132B5Z2_MOLSC|nr:uncharacterized protein LY89DRAFT_789494 [Mollisia scopiformis]KUJ07828.1 hypothetical protein LY89DRAFT_789494 [Mollisia scopiformis]